MKIGILETGYRPESTLAQHGSYADAFIALLDGHGFTYDSWAALEGELPPSIHSADGWLITGSKHGAYDDLPWIKPLEQFIVDAYEGEVPIVGICFGHQILAQALGGRVEKFEGGWSTGRVEYQLDGIGRRVPLYAWHQDQVTELPADATVAGSTDFCRYAALQYGKKAYSLQPHPEFTLDYIKDLLDARRDVIPADVAAQAEQSLHEGLTDSASIAAKIATFFKDR
jgi:GMP synthase (glutamine-hydrolysing)